MATNTDFIESPGYPKPSEWDYDSPHVPQPDSLNEVEIRVRESVVALVAAMDESTFVAEINAATTSREARAYPYERWLMAHRDLETRHAGLVLYMVRYKGRELIAEMRAQALAKLVAAQARAAAREEAVRLGIAVVGVDGQLVPVRHADQVLTPVPGRSSIPEHQPAPEDVRLAVESTRSALVADLRASGDYQELMDGIPERNHEWVKAGFSQLPASASLAAVGRTQDVVEYLARRLETLRARRPVQAQQA